MIVMMTMTMADGLVLWVFLVDFLVVVVVVVVVVSTIDQDAIDWAKIEDSSIVTKYLKHERMTKQRLP